MKKTLQSVFAWALIFCMVFMLMPITALAEGEMTFDAANGSIIITENGYYQGTETWDGNTLTEYSGSYIITGNSSSLNCITIKGGTIDITLDSLDVSTGGDGSHPAITVESGAAVNLTLVGDNTLTSTHDDNAAVNVPEDADLTIDGTGSLTAAGGLNAAGIGGNSGESAGSIRINGGTITATGGSSGAGIGGGAANSDNSGSGGSITISGGTVTASCGSESSPGTGGAGIGGGDGGSGGTINITGGTVNAKGGTRAAGIGGGWCGNGGDISISGSSTIVEASTFVDEDHTSNGNIAGAGIGNGSQCYSGSQSGTLEGYDICISDGATVTAAGMEAGIGGGFAKAPVKRSITISGSNTVVNAAANDDDGSCYDCGPGIGGDVTGDNGGTLTITISGGTVNAVGGTAGIGGDKYEDYPRNITISGGEITAESKEVGAGIGGGNCSGGEIIINGDAHILKAEAANGAGIGGSGNQGDGGSIVISGDASIEDTENYKSGALGGNGGAGIGGSQSCSGGIIEVDTTGKVCAKGGAGGAGIGGGSFGGAGGKINIVGGTIIATGSTGNNGSCAGAGIGGGNDGNGGTISISGGCVRADVADIQDGNSYTGNASAFIGGGSNGGSGDIEISGGSVYAYESHENASVYDGDANHIGHGEGYSGTDGSITISGGSVQAGEYCSYSSGDAQVRPVPQNTNGIALRPVEITLDGNGQVDVFEDAEIISLAITDSNSEKYSYGANDLFYNCEDITCMFLWLPTGEYTAEANVKMDSSSYHLSGIINVSEELGQSQGELKADSSYTDSISLDIGSSSPVTYDGNDQAPTAVVKNKSGETLAAGTDYDLVYKKQSSTSGDNTYEIVTEIKNAGSYRIYANGKGSYAGMSDDKAFHINPQYITVAYSGDSITKEYDGTTAVTDSNGDTISYFDLNVLSGVIIGDSITNVKMLNPEYVQAGVGTDIGVEGSQITCDGNGYHNYIIDAPDLTGAITAKIIGESSIAQGTLSISKDYDGTVKSVNAVKTGNLALTGGQEVTVSIAGYGDFDSKDAGNDKKVVVNLGSLSGANSANYTLAGGATAFTATATINPADYVYTVAPTQNDIPQGSGLSAIVTPTGGVGISGETVSGQLKWYKNAARTQEASDSDVSSLAVGSTTTLYLVFTASDPNYVTIPKTGSVTLTITKGQRQDLSFEVTSISKTYGDTAFSELATNGSDNGGAITYSSSNTAVAGVNEIRGEVSIIGAGTATIIATAEAVTGIWAQTTASYVLTVNQKAVTVKADNKSRTYGEDNPILTFTVPDGALAGSDTEGDLGVNLSCAATKISPAGTPVAISGIGSNNSNYKVTVEPGGLTIDKAAAPSLNDINKELIYQTAHNDVSVDLAGPGGLPADRGISNYQIGSVTDSNSIVNGSPSVDASGLLIFSTNSGEKGQNAIIPVTVQMQNYADVTLNVLVTLVDKIPVTITGVKITDKEYDGQPVTPAGTPSGVYENDQAYTGTFEYWYEGTNYTTSQIAPKDAGAYTLTVKVSESNTEFIGAASAMDFEITKRMLKVKPSSHSIHTGDTLPTPTVVYEHLVNGDVGATVATLASGSLEMEIKAADGTNKLADSSTKGTYAIKFIGSPVFNEAANYSITTADGSLSISRRSSGGGPGNSKVTPPQPKVDVDQNGTATIDLSSEKGTTSAAVSAEIIARAVKSENKNSGMVLKLPEAEMVIDTQALASIAEQVDGKDVSIDVEQVENSKVLNNKQQEMVGDRPVYDISLMSGDKAISSLGGGTISVSLPYELKPGEDANNIVVWYLDDNGNISEMVCTYDAAAQTVAFTTTHLSYYVIAYEEEKSVPSVFADVEPAAWYANNVMFVVQKHLFSGTSSTTFAPQDMMTRAMLVTVLNRLDGRSKAGESIFSDVKAGTWYADAVAWAAAKDIVSGMGNDRFGPDEYITREQMAAIFYRYAQYKGYDVSVSASLDGFQDADQISSWSRDAVKWAVGAGLISGKGNSIIDPGTGAARAEVAAILQRFIVNIAN